MIPVNVNTTFQGKVAIRDKYIKEAERTGEGIIISLENEYMIIPKQKVRLLVETWSPYPVKDRYSPDSHYLAYFDWKPTGAQRRLFSLEGVKGG